MLLYLSPGFSEEDVTDAQSDEWKDFYIERYKGYQSFSDSMPGAKWAKSRTALFGDWQTIKHAVAILNIGAYHSENFQKSYHTLAAFPSRRACLDWAQSSLFPEALKGDRVVICLRAAHYWGLELGRAYDGHLFAPPVTRSGHLMKTDWRDQVVEIVRKKIGT